MEEQNKKILFLIVALIVIFFLILMVVRAEKTSFQEKEVQTKYIVLNSNYNVYSPSQVSDKVFLIDSKTTPACKNNYGCSEKVYCYNCYICPKEYCKEKETTWQGSTGSSYSHYGRREIQEDFLGSYIARYEVYILNKDRYGKYFTVIFNFEYANGLTNSEAVTQYVKPGENKLFLYKSIQYEKREIRSWGYNIKQI